MDKDKRLHPVLRYLLNVAIAWDQLGNAHWGGDPDETISSRLGKIKRANGGQIPWSRPLPKFIDWGLDRVDPEHSIEAIEHDEGSEAVFDRYNKYDQGGDR